MAFDRNNQLPDRVRELPTAKQSLWRKTANSALADGVGSGDAYARAWGVVQPAGPVADAKHPPSHRRRRRVSPRKRLELPTFIADEPTQKRTSAPAKKGPSTFQLLRRRSLRKRNPPL